VTRTLLFIFFLIPGWISLSAQNKHPLLNSDSIIKQFSSLYKADTRLISGDFYPSPHMSPASGHPFFISPDWKLGSVRIGNQIFDSLLLRYDVHSNQVVLNTANLTNPTLQVALINHNINRLSLNNRIFIPDPLSQDSVRPSFCEVLAEGPVTLLYRISKKLSLPGAGTADYVYQTKESKTLVVDNQMIPYRGPGTLIKQYPRFSAQLRAKIRQDKLKLKRRHPEHHGRLVAYLNVLLEAEQ